MPLRPEFTQLRPDLDAFLCAPVWEDGRGASLSVLSALARLDIDPWTEATRLSALPRGAAAVALAAILRRLPRRHPEASDIAPTAARLVMLLPKGGPPRSVRHDGNPAGRTAIPWLLLALLASLAILTVCSW